MADSNNVLDDPHHGVGATVGGLLTQSFQTLSGRSQSKAAAADLVPAPPGPSSPASTRRTKHYASRGYCSSKSWTKRHRN